MLFSEGTETSEVSKDGEDFDSDSESSDSEVDDDTSVAEGISGEMGEKPPSKKKTKKILSEEEKRRKAKMKKEKVLCFVYFYMDLLYEF